MTREQQHTLRVGVVGAGIAGLATAIALRRAGHNVEVFERSSFKNEIGAAITFTPNGNRILDRWGFDPKTARETIKRQSRRVHGVTLEMLRHNDFSFMINRYGSSFNAFHRVDMHEEMKRLATAEDLPGKLEGIRLGHKVIDLDCETGAMVLESGERIQKDLIVVADGINSGFVEKVCGEDIPLKKIGVSVYRTLIPIDELRKDERIWPVFFQKQDGTDHASGFFNSIPGSTGSMMVTYPCREDTILNVALFHKTQSHEANNFDWHSGTTQADVLKAAESLHPSFSALIEHSDSWKAFVLTTREQLPTYINGKVVIIGDAAHPMQPTYAQGGNMSLEDAAAFETLFSDFTSGSSVEKRLSLWNQVRYNRAVVTQILSNKLLMDGDASQIHDRIHALYPGDIPEWGAESWDLVATDFYYGYDIYKEAAKAMKYKDAPGEIPDGVFEYFGSLEDAKRQYNAAPAAEERASTFEKN